MQYTFLWVGYYFASLHSSKIQLMSKNKSPHKTEDGLITQNDRKIAYKQTMRTHKVTCSIQYSAVQDKTRQDKTRQDKTTQYNTIQRKTLQHSTVQYYRTILQFQLRSRNYVSGLVSILYWRSILFFFMIQVLRAAYLVGHQHPGIWRLYWYMDPLSTFLFHPFST